MSSAEVIEALGPGNQLSNLNKFAASYKAANRIFIDLLTYPFLESIVLGEGQAGKQDLRAIVVDGDARFAQLCITNISIARQVISYAQTAPLILPSLTVSGYAIAMRPLVAQYVAEALASANGNEQFFEGASFQAYLLLLDNQIVLMTDKIAQLTAQIEEAKDELAHANVGSTIADIIKAIFKLSDSSEERDIQIAALLNVGLETIKSSFSQLWSDQQRLKELITGLTTLKDNLSAIKTLFTALSDSLTGIISDTKSLLNLWNDVQARLGTVETVDRNFTPQEIQEIADKWAKAEQAAKEYIEVVISSGSTKAPSIQPLVKKGVARKSTSVSKIPRTKAELRMAEIIASVGPEARAAARTRRTSPKSSSNLRDANSDFLALAGPPKATQAVLDDMALQTAGVMKQFNDMLQLPYLNQLQVNNPDKPSEKINIQDMVTNYQRLYWELQQATVPVAQDLQSYSEVVLVLLPYLVASNSATPPDVSIETYLTAHKTLADEYKIKADNIFNASLDYQRLWGNAMNAVKQAWNECGVQLDEFEATLNDLLEQYKNLSLRVCLEAAGALLLFGAAAFLPGGGLAVIGLLIADLIQLVYLAQAINEIRNRIKIARDTQTQLAGLLPYMESIAKSLVDITGVWSDIAQNLNNVQSWNKLLEGPAGANLLENAREILLANWANIRDATQKYIDIITGKGRSVFTENFWSFGE
ncbi:hypothetical protein GYMLUDRAFT_229116 [Collybiopsis luxurians FD-317 M1]|uniref:Uncharacterized protein n=1 Tax=Collybiopsis luxurians FD-317 M1 TaxID=944289 RepID=A0A0D0C562_9AGAR|nr:hypothetical protein GYMLUDRAFT_229116 [Collybiopsis luxurians FD-317 M1]